MATVLLCASTVGAAAWQAPDEPDGARVAEVFAAWDQERSPGCACAVVRGGELTFARGFGAGDLVRQVPIGPDTRFYVGSLAKQFTAALVLLLADEGRLGLDEDVRRLVPELETSVTARQLLTHTSGVRDYLQLMWLGGTDTARASLDDVYRTIFRQRGLNFPPASERATATPAMRSYH